MVDSLEEAYILYVMSVIVECPQTLGHIVYLHYSILKWQGSECNWLYGVAPHHCEMLDSDW